MGKQSKPDDSSNKNFTPSYQSPPAPSYQSPPTYSASKGLVSKPEYDYNFKIALVGDSGVGKSCLVLRYEEDAYTDSYISPSNDVAITFKNTTLDDGTNLRLQIYNSGGRERFRSITSQHFSGFNAVIVVFDAYRYP